MSKQTLKQVAYQHIKEKILNCEYMPNSFLNEDLICAQLGVSRTPVRDALGRLEQEQLIRIMPKKGFFVASISPSQVDMVFEGRILLEPYIVLNYCKNMPGEVLEAMRKSQDEYYNRTVSGEIDGIHLVDNAFHVCMSAMCPNTYILQTIEMIHNQNSRLRVLSGRGSVKRLLESHAEHAVILERLVANDVVAAATALKEHLITAKESAFRTFIN